MRYGVRVREFIKKTLIGYGIGAVIAIVYSIYLLCHHTGIIETIRRFCDTTVEAGIVCSAFIYAGITVFKLLILGVAIVFNGIENGFSSDFDDYRDYIDYCYNRDDPIRTGLGILEIMLGIVLVCPILYYIAYNYYANMIYLPVMFFLEKKNIIDGNSELCVVLDRTVFVLTIVGAIIKTIISIWY